MHYTENKLSCQEYLNYFEAVSSVECFLANGLNRLEVEEGRLVPSQRSLKKMLCSVFSQIGAFFSSYRRALRQMQCNQKMDLLRKNIAVINTIHQKCEKNQQEQAYQFHYGNAFFEYRFARLYDISVRSFERLNQRMQQPSALNRWFRSRLGNQIDHLKSLKIDRIAYNLPLFPQISTGILDMRKALWRGKYSAKPLNRFQSPGVLNVKSKHPWGNNKFLKSHQLDLIDNWALYHALRKKQTTEEEFKRETKTLQPPPSKRGFGWEKDLNDYLSLQMAKMTSIAPPVNT